MLAAILAFFAKLLGSDPLGKAIDGLNKAYDTKINGQTEQQRIEAGKQVDEYRAMLADMQDARAKAVNYPWWLALPMGFVAMTVMGHSGLIYLGSILQPLIVGSWLGGWLLHIAPVPPPYDQATPVVLAFFFGASALTLGGVIVAKAFRK